MGWFDGLSDDQMALIGCAAALAVCGAVLSASALVGRALRREGRGAVDRPSTLRLPQTATVQSGAARRKAA